MNLELLLNSLWVASLGTILALAGGTSVAFAAQMGGGWVRRFLLTGAVIVLALPAFFVAGMWMNLIGFAGAWRVGDGWWSERTLPVLVSAWVLGLLLWPITALLLVGAWEGIDRRLLEANPELRGWSLVRHVLWPAARAALAQAGVVTWLLALGQFSVPALFQAKVWTTEVWVEFSTRFAAGAALGKCLPLVAVVLLLAGWIGRRTWSWPGAGRATADLRVPMGPRCGMALRVAGIVAALGVGCLSLGLPLGLALSNPRTWREWAPALEAAGPAAVRSLGYAAGAATLVMVVGMLLARRRWPGVAILTLALPGVFVGIAVSLATNLPGLSWLREGGWVVLVALGLRYGFVGWWPAHRAWASAAPRLHEAARLVGAGPGAIWRHVIWPEGGRGLLGAWYVVYLLALWDVETLVLIVPPGGDSLSLMIFNLLHYGHNAQVTALCLTLGAIALIPWLVGGWLARRSRSGAGVIAGCLTVTVIATSTGCSPGESRDGPVPLSSKLFESVQVIGARGTGAGYFNKPRSVAVDAQDFLYVVDMTGRVQKFDPQGRWQLLWQMPETDKGKAKGMATAPDGGIMVIEPHYHRVNHFTPEGRLLEQWGEHGTNRGRFWFPRAIAVSPRGEFLVSEYGVVERVQRFRTTDHAYLGGIGEEGNGPGQLNRAEGLGVDAEGRVYVADSCNHRVQVFSPEGAVLRAYGVPGQAPGQLSYPYDVRVDRERRQYVCEFGNSRVQVFDAQGSVLEVLGGAGSGPAQMNNPWSICLDSHGNLYVADSQNHRVLKFKRRSS